MKNMKYIAFHISCLFIFTTMVFPFQYDSVDSATVLEIKPVRLAIVLGGTAAIIAAAHLQNYNSWWKGERSPFHFGEDGTYALGSDKLGHFYFTYLSSDIIGNSLAWSGIERSKALWYGAAIGLAFQYYVEIEDGFTKELGFSAGDAAADALGAYYPVFREQIPWFENIYFKWSFVRSEKFQKQQFNSIIDDYESQYFWMSGNLSSIVHSVIPDFFNIAIGYSVKNLDGLGGGERELYLGLDYDFSKLPGDGDFLIALKHALNYIHWPAPTMRITPSVVFYGLKF